MSSPRTRGPITRGVYDLRQSSHTARGYIFVFRGSPLLIQLFVIYYGLSSFAIIRASFLWPFLRDAFSCAVLSLALCTAAYSSEIFRGAYKAIAPGELEAARSVGMPRWLLVRRIIVPQALRFAIPGLGNVWQLALKESALISVVGLTEILRQAQVGAGSTRKPFAFFITAAVLYLVLSTVSGWGFQRAGVTGNRRWIR